MPTYAVGTVPSWIPILESGARRFHHASYLSATWKSTKSPSLPTYLLYTKLPSRLLIATTRASGIANRERLISRAGSAGGLGTYIHPEQKRQHLACFFPFTGPARFPQPTHSQASALCWAWSREQSGLASSINQQRRHESSSVNHQQERHELRWYQYLGHPTRLQNQTHAPGGACLASALLTRDVSTREGSERRKSLPPSAFGTHGCRRTPRKRIRSRNRQTGVHA
ncbi:hypothetical protein LX32DRAFT_277474 [Colletotrichum zoysiae]|uniref:Uncharacterized protein n=1 Tax=Colletotrichum zoysiae TaxID=1216348 RepID=A0AAD9LTB2_9PEZI|nr:hypothetical protein LX32DRAFT_277474 [Colletotrichum zoysiae]